MANLPGDVKVTKQSEDARYHDDGTTERSIRVEFFVGKHGPFVERFPREGFTAAVRDQKLTALAHELRT